MSKQRLHTKHEKSFEERLRDEAAKFREAAQEANPGTERELLLRRAEQAEAALQMTGWLRPSQKAKH